MVFRVWSATGEPTSWGGARFRYTGQAALPEVQLYYYKARMYDPHLGRFLQTDPIGYVSDYNLYAYVGNDPINRVDPTGLAFESEFGCLTRFAHCGGGSSGGTGADPEEEVQRQLKKEEGTNGGLNNGTYYPGQDNGGLIPVAGKDGIIRWVTNPGNPFAITPAYKAKFAGSPEEVAVAATIVEIAAGNYPLRENLTGKDLQLPGGGRSIYNIYSVGPPDNPGPGRIANIEGTNTYFYSPYHYQPGPGVPNAWIQVNFPVLSSGP